MRAAYEMSFDDPAITLSKFDATIFIIHVLYLFYVRIRTYGTTI